MRRNNQKLNASVVITNFNGKELLEKNLPAVINAKNNKDNNIIEVIIVDDFSSDDSLRYLNTLKSDISIIKHTKNRGFSAAINTGVRATKGDLVVLLSTDVSPEVNFLESSLKLFEDPQVFGVTFHKKGLGSFKGLFADGYIQQFVGKELNKVVPSFYTDMGSGVFKKTIWKELGGMDEKLFSQYYWGDVDLSYRANKRGYLNLWNPNAIVDLDDVSITPKISVKKEDIIKDRNQLLVHWKNIHSKNMLDKHVFAIIKRILKHIGYIKVVFSALLKLPLVLKERKKEVKESIVSDEAVFQRYQ